MGNTIDLTVTSQVLYGAAINPGRLQKFLAKRAAKFLHMILHRHLQFVKEDPANKGISIAVQAAGTYSDKLVPHRNLRAIKELLILGHPNNKSSQVILPFSIEIGHFRGLSAYKGTIGLFTSSSYSLHYIYSLIYIQPPH